MSQPPYEALLVVSFGGPEAPDEVLPFLENVLRGRRVPRARMLAVAAHYQHCGGRSPINEHNRALVRALQEELDRAGPRWKVYWGNRNWYPLLADTLRQMAADGVRRALAFVTSPFGSFSGCRQYLEDIARARAAVDPSAPEVAKLRLFFNHPDFIAVWIAHAQAALVRLPPHRRATLPLLFTAHSIPLAMAAGSPYVSQLEAACGWVAAGLGRRHFRLAYQSRSGPLRQPWLEPDLATTLRALADQGHRQALLLPIGFLSDHMEVVYDLDCEARALASRLGLELIRAATPGTHPRLIAMIRDLVRERLAPIREPAAMAGSVAWPDRCPADCCAAR